jgi:ActR/RegA family two-component response regulator
MAGPNLATIDPPNVEAGVRFLNADIFVACSAIKPHTWRKPYGPRRSAMPARIVIVHDDPAFIDALARKLGPDVAWFAEPLAALAALKSANTIRFLITRLSFADRQPVGLSLARLAREARPDVRVVFTGMPEHREYARGLGEFIPEPADATHVGMVIEWLR